ncbi:hypothetical protein [Streptacidiphilus fuscans]|uniref:Uncharacterized protein n=2 Tax=Streptacidiphilus TaxID=228398 RepID=A0A931FEK4_9ACTN|nr:hypothetical protein [Streptacidiphilus fuscans]MBF9067594.1 hypothetical protein [Streptacidiphilus fuscans]
MSVLAWWIIPLVGGVLAALWVTWSSRTRTTGDYDSLQGYERFREAMERKADGPEA